jgi:catechol 2,3-dioxygenase-like lactoylglutathione lyase family enzyme
MIKFKRTDHINICVPTERLEEAREFYINIIGLQPTHRPDVFDVPGYWFLMADIELHIGIEPALPPSNRHTAFVVEDLDECRRYLEANGIAIKEEPCIPGRNRFTFVDPFSNRLELMEFI